FNRLSLVCCIVILHIAAISIVQFEGKDINSPYDLYYKSSFPVLSVDRLGLLTTMRLDLQRLITGWSPVIDVVAPVEDDFLQIPEPSPIDEIPSQDKEEDEEVIEYNTMDIDFQSLIEEEENKDIQNMHKYFSSIEPTKKNEYTGIYEGYNLIFITAEGF